MARKTKGRQKISMTKMQNESNLQVTFSKRRAGLFKKASELATLCGAEVGIIVFSPGKKAFSFGHPSVDAIIDRFLTRNSGLQGVATNATQRLVEAHRSATVRDLNAQLTHVQGVLEMERRRGHVLDQMRAAELMAAGGQRWWEGPVDQMNFAQLEQFKAALEELKAGVAKQVEKIVQEQPAKPPAAFPAPAAAATVSSGGASAFAPFSAGSSALGGRSGVNITPFDARTSWSGGGASSSGSGLPYGFGHGFGRGFF